MLKTMYRSSEMLRNRLRVHATAAADRVTYTLAQNTSMLACRLSPQGWNSILLTGYSHHRIFDRRHDNMLGTTYIDCYCQDGLGLLTVIVTVICMWQQATEAIWLRW